MRFNKGDIIVHKRAENSMLFVILEVGVTSYVIKCNEDSDHGRINKEANCFFQFIERDYKLSLTSVLKNYNEFR